MLYANAETYAATGRLLSEYTFTYSLSLNKAKTEVPRFLDSAVGAARVVHELIDPASTAPLVKLINES